ncbi:MAG: RidA family protein [Patescibacteria group bacterium]
MWRKELLRGTEQDWPYSQYSEAGSLVILSGQTALKDGKLVPGGIREQARQAIDNCMSIVHRLGMDERNVVDVQVVLRDIDEDRQGFEEVYDGELFPDPRARASRTLFGGKPANDSLIDIKMVLSRSLPHRGPPGEVDTDDAGQIK